MLIVDLYFEKIELPAKLLDYFVWSNNNRINQTMERSVLPSLEVKEHNMAAQWVPNDPRQMAQVEAHLLYANNYIHLLEKICEAVVSFWPKDSL